MSGRLNWDKARAAKLNAHEPTQGTRAYLREHKPLTDKQRTLIVRLRAELGVLTVAMPATCHEGREVIDALLDRKKAA